MHYYDYSFLKDYSITSKLIGLSNVIAESNYKIKLQKSEYPYAYFKLHEKAVIDSTISSSRIEGIQTSEIRSKELLIDNSKPLTHDEEEISGYKDAIVYISEHYNEMPISENTIKLLHSMLMHYTPSEKGEYKKVDNQISIRYQGGSNETIFKPVSSKDVDENMKNLLKAYDLAKADSEINQMLLIPCFILDFLAIHPFTDGNGRVSRLLTLLLLYKEGYEIGKFISYEKMIEEYKWNYYQELNKSQTDWHENSNNYSFFIVFHFQMLYRCYMEINNRFMCESSKGKATKSERIESIIMKSIVPISKGDISNALPDVSVTTIEKTISELIKENKIVKIGTYKNARYIRK